MAHKQIAFDQEAREAISRGVKRLAKTIKVTLGPKGRNVMIERGYGPPLVTKDGVTVAKELSFEDGLEDIGAQMVKEVASKTSDAAGDGTTTATVIAEALFESGLAALGAGVQPVHFKRGVAKAQAHVVAALREASQEVSSNDQIAQVGGIAANNDVEVGKVLAQAMEKVGKDGVITVDQGNSLETEVEFLDGLSIDRGYLSPYFVNDQENMTCVLENVRVLFVEGKVSAVKDLIPVLEVVLGASAPLLIVAEDVEGESLALMVVNAIRGTLKSCAIKSPGFGDDRKARIQDLAILTGGRVISLETGVSLDGAGLDDLGLVDRVVVRKDETELVGGHGDKALINARLDQIKAQLKNEDNTYEAEKLETRIAKLSGGVAQILVGAATEPEMKDKKARIEDAIFATRAAVEEGIVPGGGVALLRASRGLDGIEASGDERLGVSVVRDALEAPVRQIASNAGLNPSLVVKAILDSDDFNYGLNALTGEYCDLLEAGVIDPTKVARTAFENAVSVSTLLLTTDCLITDVKEESAHSHDEAHFD
ncbi:MAG: chaperonin GroEL [Planctomycetes bacterium]|nr:chaperonin GroEL [Planctomycetota bacterium]